jgi:hypothetical protein
MRMIRIGGKKEKAAEIAPLCGARMPQRSGGCGIRLDQ